jgi:hypothetical protein
MTISPSSRIGTPKPCLSSNSRVLAIEKLRAKRSETSYRLHSRGAETLPRAHFAKCRRHRAGRCRKTHTLIDFHVMKKLWQLHPIQATILSACLTCFPLSLSSQTEAPSATPSSAAEQQRAIADLRAQVEALQKKVEYFGAREALLATRVSDKKDREDSVTLDVTHTAYQRLDTDNGFLLVSAEKAEPYLNGYKILLNVGNPLSVSYSGLKAKIKWAKYYDSNQFTPDSYAEWQKSIQQKETSFPDVLEKGAWKKIELIVAPATAEQLGYLKLSINTKTVMVDAK